MTYFLQLYKITSICFFATLNKQYFKLKYNQYERNT